VEQTKAVTCVYMYWKAIKTQPDIPLTQAVYEYLSGGQFSDNTSHARRSPMMFKG